MDRRKILVFGDDRHLFRTIGWVLEYKGYDVRLAPSPEAALTLLIEQNFDLVIAKLCMEDLQSLDVLKRAQKLNPEVRIMVVSVDSNAAFPLEAFRIEVEDYLLLPITPTELMHRVGQCLGEAAAVKAAKAVPVKRGVTINQKLPSEIMIMLHDIRSGLAANAASLKLLKRGRYGGMNSQGANKVQELLERVNNFTILLDEFADEMLSGHGQAAASQQISPWQYDLP